VGGGEAVDPLGRGGEQDVMTGLAGSMAITIAKNAAADVRTSFRAPIQLLSPHGDASGSQRQTGAEVSSGHGGGPRLDLLRNVRPTEGGL
jgi:hypothetical protein